jgi:catechol 2,3-dioxygenase-like lactoylglutathione lyase family enzyme
MTEWAMFTGAHAIIYTKDADKDRAFFRDVLGFKWIDSGGGWLLFKLPPAELAFHPGEAPTHELYLMTDDVREAVKDLTAKGIKCEPVKDQGWGLLTRFRLPGGGMLGLYEPRHPRP